MRALLVIVATPAIAFADDGATTNVSVGGYVEAYYQLNFRAPSNHITNLRGFDNRDRTFTLSNAVVDVKGTRGPVAARVILQIGSTPATYYLAEPGGPGTSAVSTTGADQWKHLQQATLAYTRGALVVDAGLFPSPIGPEVFAIKDNWNWSRSDLFFGLPFYHTGARASYELGGGWTGQVHVYNGWNSVVDNNAYPSVAASAAYASDAVSGQVLYFGGVERATGAPEGAAWRHLLDGYASMKINHDVTLMGHVDAGIEPNDLGTSTWLGGAVYGKAVLSRELYAAFRADAIREHVAERPGVTASSILFPTSWIASGTATLAVQPVDNLSIRLELRHDGAAERVFFGGSVMGDGVTTPFVPDRRSQDTFTVGATAWF